jgi:MFS family permease
MTLVAIRLLDRVGRRTLLIGGTCGMAVALAVIAITFQVGGSHLAGTAAIVTIVFLFFYTGSFAIGLGPVFWLLISEIYPVRVRAPAMSVATFANWAANFVVTISFLTLLNAMTDAGTFFLFTFLTLVAAVYFWRRVPETKGLRLEHIGAQIEGRRLTPGAVTARRAQ